MISRRKIIFALAASPLAASFRAYSQQPGKIWRIGVLAVAPSADPRAAVFWTPLVDGLRELGYVEGKNISIEARFSGTDMDRLRELADELVRLRVDIIIAVTTAAAQAARKATATIPIVFTNVADPVVPGLVASLAPSGENMTGLSSMVAELTGKRVELLKETLPTASRVAVLWLKPSRASGLMFEQAEAAGARLGLQVQSLGVVGASDLQGAFAAASRNRAGAVFVIDSPAMSSYRSLILDLAMKRRLPVVSQNAYFTEAGGLLSYGIDLRDHYRRAATYIDKILKGARPGDLPVEQPTKFELVINLKTARALGITIPQSILLRADRVIE
jgi:putative ABC transport system substrate-binding protein